MVLFSDESDDDKYDVYGLFKPLIEKYHIAPSEYWKMGIVEIFKLMEITTSEKQDGSLYVNEKRVMSGMDRTELRNLL